MTSRPLAVIAALPLLATGLLLPNVEPAHAARSLAPDPFPAQYVVPGKHLRPKPPKPTMVLPLATYRLTARFGASGLWAHTHTGLDFAAPVGTPIRAVADGVITSTGWDGSYGNKTVLTMADGTELWFAHQSDIAVSVGQRVAAGRTIGYVGATGNVTGPHLHLEVRPGDQPIDPYPWLVEHGLHP